MTTKNETGTGTLNVSKLDAALNAVKNRKAAKEGSTGTTEKPAKQPKAAKEPTAPKRPRLTEEEKAARETAKTNERAAKKEARDAARATKKAEKDAAKQPAHMKKVLKAAEKLGPLGQAAQLLFAEATANLTAAEVAQLANHLAHFNRVKATERALSQKIEQGTNVRIVGGDPRFIGKTGTVSKAQRIRCYVKVDGIEKPVYLFTSDVESIAVQANETAAAAS